jgi:putative ABC transport system permease protein
MGIPLIRGREFTRQDNEDAPPVIIVDESMVERYWPGEDPIGKRIKWGGYATPSTWKEVVGVAGHVKVNGVVNETLPQIYLPHWQDNDNNYFLIVRTRGEPLALVETIRQSVLALDPALPLASVGTMSGYSSETTRSQELLALLMGIFSVAAILLAGVGIYGVMAQATAERRHEIGVRVALGARDAQVVQMVFRQGSIVVLSGILLGMGLAVAGGRLIASQLFQVSALDPVTFAVTPLVVVAVATVANVLPAWRATKVDPVRALQTE